MRETVEQWLRLAGLNESALEATTTLVLLCAVLALAWVVDFVVRKSLLRFATALAKRTQSTWDDKLLEHRAFHRGAHIVGALVVYAFAPMIFAHRPTLNELIRNVLEAYVVLVTLLAITGALRAFLDVYQAKHPEMPSPDARVGPTDDHRDVVYRFDHRHFDSHRSIADCFARRTWGDDRGACDRVQRTRCSVSSPAFKSHGTICFAREIGSRCPITTPTAM